MRKCTFGRMTRSVRHGPRSADISTSTIACVRTRALIARHRTKPTSARHPWRWRHEFSAVVFPASPVGYALPTPRETRHSVTNPAGTHLSFAGTCSDERGQLYRRRADVVAFGKFFQRFALGPPPPCFLLL